VNIGWPRGSTSSRHRYTRYPESTSTGGLRSSFLVSRAWGYNLSMDEKTLSMADVMHLTDLSIGARILWWELNHAWIGHGIDVCFPLQPTLAKILGVSRSSIIRWLQELSDTGLLQVERQQRGNRYVLTQGTTTIEE